LLRGLSQKCEKALFSLAVMLIASGCAESWDRARRQENYITELPWLDTPG